MVSKASVGGRAALLVGFALAALAPVAVAQFDSPDDTLTDMEGFSRKQIFEPFLASSKSQRAAKKSKLDFLDSSSSIINANAKALDRSNNALRTFQGVLHGALAKHRAQKAELLRKKQSLSSVKDAIEGEKTHITQLRQTHTQLILDSKQMAQDFKAKFSTLNTGLARYQKVLRFIQGEILKLRKKMAWMHQEGPKELEKMQTSFSKAQDVILALHARIGQVKVEMMRHQDYLSSNEKTLKKSMALHDTMTKDHTIALRASHKQALSEQNKLKAANSRLTSATSTLAQARRVIKNQQEQITSLEKAKAILNVESTKLDAIKEKLASKNEEGKSLLEQLQYKKKELAVAHQEAQKTRHTTNMIHYNQTKKIGNVTAYLDHTNQNLQKVNHALRDVTRTLNRADVVLKEQKKKFSLEKVNTGRRLRLKQEQIDQLAHKLKTWRSRNDQLKAHIQTTGKDLTAWKVKTNKELETSKKLKGELVKTVKATKKLLARDREAISYANQAAEQASESLKGMRNAAQSQSQVNEILQNQAPKNRFEAEAVLSQVGNVLDSRFSTSKKLSLQVPEHAFDFHDSGVVDGMRYNHNEDNYAEKTASDKAVVSDTTVYTKELESNLAAPDLNPIRFREVSGDSSMESVASTEADVQAAIAEAMSEVTHDHALAHASHDSKGASHTPKAAVASALDDQTKDDRSDLEKKVDALTAKLQSAQSEFA